jgi:hypothetical protein
MVKVDDSQIQFGRFAQRAADQIELVINLKPAKALGIISRRC